MYRAFAVFIILLVAVFAIKLRVESSNVRLAHADEGEQAWTFLKLYNTGEYAYSPEGAHGATLYYWAYFTKKIEGAFREPKLEIVDLRLTLVPIFLLSILAFFALKSQVDFGALGIGILAWGVSALSVLYSLYFVQEIFFALGVFLAMSYFYLAISRQSLSDFVFLGLACGFAQATKESFVIVLGALFLPCVFLLRYERVKFSIELFKSVMLSVLCGFVVYAIFYSSFGANPRGIVDGIVSYLHFFDKAQGAEHSKDFLYYARILFLQKSQGVCFGELLISFFAIVGAVLGFAKGHSLMKFIASFCFMYFLILSLIPYKTPWLLLSLIMPMCVLFGYAFWEGLKSKNLAMKFATFCALIGVVYCEGAMSKKACVRFANDARNPFTYVHTTGDAKNLLSRISQVKELYPEVKVAFDMKNSPFPLPYYLLKYDNIAYNENLENIKAEIILTDKVEIAENIDHDFYQEELYGLRENLIIYLYVKKEIFEKIIE